MKRSKFTFLGVLVFCALMSMTAQAQHYTIVHTNGVSEDVSIENFYPGGGPSILGLRNQTTVLLPLSDIVRMERLKTGENTFKVTFVSGEVEEIQIVTDARIEGKSRVPDTAQGRNGWYCASVGKITSIERSSRG